MIVGGGQVKYEDARIGVYRAELLALCQQDDRIIATASFKNPRNSYIERVFALANVPKLMEGFRHELGYIVTREGFEGQHICQQLLNELLPKINRYPMFATTRKAAMLHILEKLGFEKSGEIYKGDLQLLTFKP